MAKPAVSVLAALGELGRDAILIVHQTQREIRLDAWHHVAQPAQRNFVGRHLEQGPAEIVVLAAHAGITGAQPLAGNELPTGVGFQSLDRGAAEIDRLLAIGRVGRPRRRRRRRCRS